MKISLFMWTKNSEQYLESVIKSIENAIPKSCIEKKIIIDDRSTDKTKEIVQGLGWTYTINENGGIIQAFNQARQTAKTEFFATFEHDIILASNWFETMLKHILVDNFVCCQGVRSPSNQILKIIYENKVKKLRRKEHSLDNNLWKTKEIKKIPIPKNLHHVADRYIKKETEKLNLKWIIDSSSKSVHIKEGIRENKEHFFKMAKSSEMVPRLNERRVFIIEGLKNAIDIPILTIKKRNPKLMVVYPYMALKTIQTRIKLGKVKSEK